MAKEKNAEMVLLFKGKFSETINEEMTFDLPLSFPISTVKCKVDKAEKDEEVEVSCKAQKFKNVNSFVIEPRLIKKKHKEILLQNRKNLNSMNHLDVKIIVL